MTTTVPLGTASSFAILAGSAITNTGPTVINGNMGIHPNGITSITGFPPGLVNGAVHAANAVALQAQSDLTIAYNNAANRPCGATLTGVDLGGQNLTSGVYCFATSAQLTGTLILNGQNNPNSVFIFKIGSTLTTASNSSIILINGAQACNVFFQVGSSATLGTDTRFIGNILDLTSITANTRATVNGRLLARNGAVTLDSNVITRADCLIPPTPTPTPTPGSVPGLIPGLIPGLTPGLIPGLIPGSAPILIIDVSPAVVSSGGNIVLATLISGNNPTGIVTFIIDKLISVAVPVINGTARILFNTTGLSPGLHKVFAIYFGDIRNNIAISSKVTFDIIDKNKLNCKSFKCDHNPFDCDKKSSKCDRNPFKHKF